MGKKQQSKNASKKKRLARKEIRKMVLKYNFEKNIDTFSESLEKKRHKNAKLDQILKDAEIDSIYSFTNYFEDNSFSSSVPEEENVPSFNKSKNAEKKNNIKNFNMPKTEVIDLSAPLKDKKIVLTGIMKLPKEIIKVILEKLGAKVTSEISGKTNILIYGDILEDGRKYNMGKKYIGAVEKKIPIYSYDMAEKYIQELLGDNNWSFENEAKNFPANTKVNIKNIVKEYIMSLPNSFAKKQAMNNKSK